MTFSFGCRSELTHLFCRVSPFRSHCSATRTLREAVNSRHPREALSLASIKKRERQFSVIVMPY